MAIIKIVTASAWKSHIIQSEEFRSTYSTYVGFDNLSLVSLELVGCAADLQTVDKTSRPAPISQASSMAVGMSLSYPLYAENRFVTQNRPLESLDSYTLWTYVRFADQSISAKCPYAGGSYNKRRVAETRSTDN